MPRKAPGLLALVQRAVTNALFFSPKSGRMPNGENVSALGYVAYDDVMEKFDPMSVEEIKQLRDENPDRPIHCQPSS